MNNDEQKMPNKIEQLETRMDELEKLIYFNHLSDDAIVGKDYVAKLFNCSEADVAKGRHQTNRIRRIRQKPLAFRKGDVHQVLRDLNKPIAVRAAEERAKVKPRKRSIIKNNKKEG